jgi:hypothetical protein
MSRKREETPREEPQLIELLNEELYFLINSAKLFDSGHIYESKRLATTTRVILHKTEGCPKNPQKCSLLHHLGKEDIGFLDTTFPYTPENRVAYLGSIVMGISTDSVDYVAPLSDVQNKKWISFSEWWNENPIFQTPDGENRYSRKDIALNLANKEGGAHVDPHIQENLEKMRTYYKEQWKVKGTKQKIIENSFKLPFDYVAMRQIAYELIETLSCSFNDLPKDIQLPPRKKRLMFGGITIK